jgi:hypothetical protein
VVLRKTSSRVVQHSLATRRERGCRCRPAEPAGSEQGRTASLGGVILKPPERMRNRRGGSAGANPRGLDPSELAPNESSFLGQDRPRVSGALLRMRAGEAEPPWSEALSQGALRAAGLVRAHGDVTRAIIVARQSNRAGAGCSVRGRPVAGVVAMTKCLRPVFAVIVICAAGAARSSAAQPASAALAAGLGAAMAERQLEAIAVRDPAAPDRYIAAMHFPNVQLLVVGGQYPSPAYLDALIAERKYKDVYIALQHSVVPGTKVFFHDMGADGLPADDDGAVDVLYEQVTTQTTFNGDWKSQRLSEREYNIKLAKAEQIYRGLLQPLLAAAKAPAAAAIIR